MALRVHGRLYRANLSDPFVVASSRYFTNSSPSTVLLLPRKLNSAKCHRKLVRLMGTRRPDGVHCTPDEMGGCCPAGPSVGPFQILEPWIHWIALDLHISLQWMVGDIDTLDDSI